MNQDIWRALLSLFRLLRSEVNSEKEYQRYFEQNPVVFRALGYDSWASFEQSSKNKLPYDQEMNRQHEPDFILGKKEQDIAEVFEIKTPFLKGLTTSRRDKREDFRAQITSYLSQARNYKRFLDRNANARHVVCKTLGLRKATNIQATLVCGMIDSEDPAFIKLLADERDIGFISYDQLFFHIANQYGANRTSDPALFPNETRVDYGCTICVVVRPRASQNHSPAYIFDTQGEKTNPFSLYFDKGRFVFRVSDVDGNQYHCTARVKAEQFSCLLLEFASSDRGNFLSFSINGEERNLQINTDGIKIENIQRTTLFADAKKEKFFAGDLSYKMMLSRPLTLEERLELNIFLAEQFPFAFD